MSTPRQRKVAQIPKGNPLTFILGRDLLNRAAARQRHGKTVVTVDYFCGAGGLTTGIERARESLGLPGYHYGINHDERSIQTISSNHFGTFINSNVESIPIRDIVQEGYVTLFAGSAECLMYSPARSTDAPILDQSRTNAAYMLESIRDLPPEAFILENVKEWMSWGRLDAKKRPVARYAGEYFRAFIKALQKMGYALEYRVLNSADFGAYTSRERLFVCGVASGRPVVWPVQTHAKNPSRSKDPNIRPWNPAKDIIDWDDLGTSLFSNSRGPHAPKSLRRMKTGYVMQTVPLAQAYADAIDRFLPISEAFHATRAPKFDFTVEDFRRNRPLQAYCARPRTDETCSPYTAKERVTISNIWRALYDLPRAESELSKKERSAIYKRGKDQARAATRLAFAKPVTCFTYDELLNAEPVEDFTFANKMNNTGKSTETEPVPVITSGGSIALVSSMVLGQHGGGIAHMADREPAPTIARSGALAVVRPTIVKMNACEKSAFADGVRSVEKPYPAILPKTCLGLQSPVQPVLFQVNHGDNSDRILDQGSPLPTQTGKRSVGLASPFISRTNTCHGQDQYSVEAVEKPLSPAMAINHHGLVCPIAPAAAFVARMHGYYDENRGTESVDQPVSSIGAGGMHHAIVSPTAFLMPQQGYNRTDVRSTDKPVQALTSLARVGLVQPSIVNYYGDRNNTSRESTPISEPLPTIPTANRFGVVEPMILNHASDKNGSNRTSPANEEPCPAITASGSGYLLNARGPTQARPGAHPDSSLRPYITVSYLAEDQSTRDMSYEIDILFRMLTPRELAKAMGFVTKTHEYTFAGKTCEQVRQIGNAVEATLGEKLAFCQLSTVMRFVRAYEEEAVAA